jgi:ornithine carbamoyltransferase
MRTPLIHRHLATVESLSRHDMDTVVANARTLQRFAQAGTPVSPLRGKNFALMSEQDDDADASLFCSAAETMGARVAHIRPSLSELSTAGDVVATARMLGRLYDAVECQGMARLLVAQVGRDAGIPVYDALASSQHPTARLALLLGDDSSPADNRRFVLQAMLVGAVG